MRRIDGIPVWGEPTDEGALAQIKNCAKEASHVALMADHHKGYAVPIGGVVAYEDKISPSGVGFDIACLAEGTRVVAEDGYWRPIEAIAGDDALTCWDGDTVRRVDPHFGPVPKGEGRPVLRLTLINGRALRVTADHQIRTSDGWKAAGDLRAGDRVACHPFVGLPCVAAGRVGSGLWERPIPIAVTPPRLQQELSDRALLPLSVSTAGLPVVVRLLGAICGDGHLARDGKRISIYTAHEGDAEQIRQEFARLGYRAGLHKRERSAIRKPEYHVYVTSQALHALFSALGAPVGKKSWPAKPMPWLFGTPPWVRAQFLSGFCSAEATTPRIGACTIPNLALKQTGADTHAREWPICGSARRPEARRSPCAVRPPIRKCWAAWRRSMASPAVSCFTRSMTAAAPPAVSAGRPSSRTPRVRSPGCRSSASRRPARRVCMTSSRTTRRTVSLRRGSSSTTAAIRLCSPTCRPPRRGPGSRR